MEEKKNCKNGRKATEKWLKISLSLLAGKPVTLILVGLRSTLLSALTLPRPLLQMKEC